jgi:carbonic anhydrase
MTFTITNNGVTASYPEDGCTKNSVEIPGVNGVYEALQYHIHLSSEHTIDGHHYGAELHIVHKSTSEDRYAVVGMMINPDNEMENPLFGVLLEQWIASASAKKAKCSGVALPEVAAPTGTINPYELLVPGSSFYHYDGGLTTPPCSEVVWWNLADIPVHLSIRQFNLLTTIIFQYRDDDCKSGSLASPAGGTSRPVQPYNGRVVKHICPALYDDMAYRGPALTTQVVQQEKVASSASMLTHGAAAATVVAGLAALL